jgi:glycosyltransferase involved in cell wall biosynthesis
LNGRVVFHGKVDHAGVVALLKQADIFCYPTQASEGFPKVVLEALACGLPVVTTRVSVLPVLMARGGGVLLDVVSPSAVARGVIDALSDEEAYRDMSRRATETARRYSLESWRDTIAELLNAAWSAPTNGGGEVVRADI